MLQLVRPTALLCAFLCGIYGVSLHADGFATTAPLDSHATPVVAIIIDDIGYQGRLGEVAVALPGPFALAIMPYAPHSNRLAELATAARKNIILHLPMEAYSRNHLLGKGALLSGMEDSEIRATLARALASLPQAIGINNHMGSLFTSHRPAMDVVMGAIAARGDLFFVDSRTSGRSAARQAADAVGVTMVERHIFLDNEPIRASIKIQLERLVTHAKQYGRALAIGHPYPATLAMLEAWRPDDFGVELVSLAEYVAAANAPAETANSFPAVAISARETPQ
ncbi:MAG: divergent polysaccharide deacetylase family protein [Pseudomonadota bacterium]